MKIKFLLAFIMIVLLSFGLCSCSDDEDSSSNDNSDASDDDDDDDDDNDDDDNDNDDDNDDDNDTVPPQPLKIMTFNLRLGVAVQDGENWWPFRKGIVTNLIAQEIPDVFGTQEGWKFQLDYIKNTLPEYDWTGVARYWEWYDEYSAVFYNTDRLTLLQSDTFWLSDTPDVQGSKFSENQLCPRIVTWCEFEQIDSGFRFFVFNTHFDTTNQDEVPQKSAALMVTQIQSIGAGAPVFATGDFNEAIDSYAYQILTGDMTYDGATGDLIDPWVTLDLPEEGTFHGFSGTASGSSRIDWVLASEDFSPIDGAVSHYNEDGQYPSDHFPVWAEFDISKTR